MHNMHKIETRRVSRVVLKFLSWQEPEEIADAIHHAKLDVMGPRELRITTTTTVVYSDVPKEK